jgi:hypothetical protein
MLMVQIPVYVYRWDEATTSFHVASNVSCAYWVEFVTSFNKTFLVTAMEDTDGALLYVFSLRYTPATCQCTARCRLCTVRYTPHTNIAHPTLYSADCKLLILYNARTALYMKHSAL